MISAPWALALNPSIKEMSKSIITRDKESLLMEELNISEKKKESAHLKPFCFVKKQKQFNKHDIKEECVLWRGQKPPSH